MGDVRSAEMDELRARRESGGGSQQASFMYADEEIGIPDLQMPVARRHRSTWPLLHLPSTSHHLLDQTEGSRVWIGQ